MKLPSRASLACLTLLAFSLPLSFARADAMFRGNARRTGVYATTRPANLQVKWQFKTAEAILSSPAVTDGTVYFGSADNGVYAVDAATGALRWRFDAHGNVHSSPAIANGTVFVVSGDGQLHALDAATGAQKWSFATGGERRFTKPGVDYLNPATELMPDPWDFFLSSPVVADGTVFFGSGDHHVYAVDATTGKLKWKYLTGDVVHASPAVANGMVYVGSFDAFFYALDAATGSPVWKFQTGRDDDRFLLTGIPGSAAVDDGLVFFGSRDAKFYALDARTGELRWKHSLGNSWVVASPAVTDGNVCFTTSDTHEFVVLNAKTGVPVFALPHFVYSFSSPAVAESYAYFGTFDGRLHAVDLARHAYAEVFATAGYREHGAAYLDAKGELNSAAIWIGDTLDDAIVGIRTKLFSLGSILASPAIQDGVLYIGSADGTLYALGVDQARKAEN